MERERTSQDSSRGTSERCALVISVQNATIGGKVRNALRESEAWYRETGIGLFEIQSDRDELDRVSEHLGLWLDSSDLEASRALLTQLGDGVPVDALERAPSLRAVIADQWRGALARLIEDERLIVRFQPLVHASRTDAVIGHEAFLRGISTRNLIVLPERLLDAAERADRLLELDETARSRAFQDAVASGLEGLVFVNASPHSVTHERSYVKTTLDLARRADLPSARVVIEIGRGQRATLVDELSRFMSECQGAGMAVALDDLSASPHVPDLIRTLKPQYAKVDRRLVGFIDRDPWKREALARIIAAAREAGVITVAVGVERSEELDVVRQTGVDLVQGYYIALPASARRTTSAPSMR